MTVYVDDMFAPFRRMKMCHMIADTPEELRLFASLLELKPEWIQYPGTYCEHFDVSMEKRTEAIKLGAVPITYRQLSRMIWDRRPQ